MMDVIRCVFVVAFSMFTTYAMEDQSAIKPIDVLQTQCYPAELIQSITQEEFVALENKAKTGHALSQYYLGMRYLAGNNPLKIKDLENAEEWLIKSQKQDCLPAYVALIGVAKEHDDAHKLIAYSLQAVQRGILTCNYYVASGYEILKRRIEAIEYFEAAYNAITKNPDIYSNVSFKGYILVAIAKYWYHSEDEQKKAKAVKIFQTLAVEDHPEGIYHLAVHYVCIQNNAALKKLLYHLEKEIPVPQDTRNKFFYDQTITLLGLILESDGDIERAKYYYKKTYDETGKYFLANLVLLDEMEGDKQAAVALMESMLVKQHYLAVQIFNRYVTYLISQNNIEDALELDKKFNSPNDPDLINQLQFGIAYFYGHGVKKDTKIAQHYFENILNSNKTEYASKYVATGYMHLVGLGVKKDIPRGMELITLAESKTNDLRYTVSTLFPLIEIIKEELSQKVAATLLRQEISTSKNKTKKINTIAVKTDSVSQIFDITPQRWNSLFKTQDGSYVLEIKKHEKTFTILDPKHNEHLVVESCAARKKNYSQIDSLNFHPRIMQRKGKGSTLKKLSDKTIHDHDFAQMLDYVIQYVGKLVPFVKPSSKLANDQLIAPVIRHNLTSGQKVLCNAEYGFGEKDNDFYVYHRLLRPVKALTDDDQKPLGDKS